MTRDDALLDRIEQLARSAEPRAGSTRVIAIDGRAGAGKTTLAHELAARLDAPIVQLEQIYPGWDGLQAGIDLLVEAVLVPLSAGAIAQVPATTGWSGASSSPGRSMRPSC